MNNQERIALALQCSDCDSIPKVSGAGSVEEGPEGPVQIMHNGIRLFCDSHYGDYNVEVIKGLRGHHEPQEEGVFDQVLQRLPAESVMVELGAFWGYYSLWFLDSVARSRAILVEPVPSALECGKRNFNENDMVGQFVHAAIGKDRQPEKEVELWKGMVVEVSTHSVDSLLAAERLPRIGILHADIQGHEVQMLHGAETALREKSIDWVFISTHGENIHQRCLQILRGHGYAIAAEHTPGESFSVDGLIVASSRQQKPLGTISRRQTRESVVKRWRAAVRVRILEPFGLKPVTV